MTGELQVEARESKDDMGNSSQPSVCPVMHASAEKKVNQPIQAKRYVPTTQVKPTPLQKPGENDMDEFSYTEIVDCPVNESFIERIGKWFGPLNLVPFFTALESLVDSIKTFRKKAAMFPNDPCVRCNLGRDCVLLVGHAAVHWLLTQPLENIDRDSTILGFGPLQIGDYYLGKSIPCLIASEPNGHSKQRKLMMKILMNRLPDLNSSVENAFTYRLNQLIDGFAKDPKSTNITSASIFLAGHFVLQWLAGAEPPSTRAIVEYGPRSFGKTSTDNWLGRFLGQMIDNIVFTLDGSYQLQDQLVRMVRSSRYYKLYENMAKEIGVETQDLDKNLSHTFCLSGNFGLGLTFASTVAVIGEQLGSLSELRKEIGMDELTLESFSDPNKYPLLDAFAWEVERAFIRGQIVPRIAKKDLLVPGGNGKAYRVKKNDYLLGYHPLANRDPSVFDNPDRFNPRRFYDNPDLKKKVFPFGIPCGFDPRQAEWGCPVYAVGFGMQLIKLFFGKWIQRVDWAMAEPVQFSGNAIGEYRPGDAAFSKLQYRQEYLDWLRQRSQTKTTN